LTREQLLFHPFIGSASIQIICSDDLDPRMDAGSLPLSLTLSSMDPFRIHLRMLSRWGRRKDLRSKACQNVRCFSFPPLSHLRPKLTSTCCYYFLGTFRARHMPLLRQRLLERRYRRHPQSPGQGSWAEAFLGQGRLDNHDRVGLQGPATVSSYQLDYGV
jgi:hypothetical protein